MKGEGKITKKLIGFEWVVICIKIINHLSNKFSVLTVKYNITIGVYILRITKKYTPTIFTLFLIH